MLSAVATPEPASPAAAASLALASPLAPSLGLSELDIETGLKAIGDAEDRASTDDRVRLARVRGALERELARQLAA